MAIKQRIVYVIVEPVLYMETGVRLRSVSVLVILVGLLSVSYSASATNNLFYNEAIVIADADDGLRTIEVDATGNMFASHGQMLYKMSQTGSILMERTFSKEITATAISPDSTKLALTLRSGGGGEDSIFVLSTGDLSTLASSDATRTNASILEWSPNGGDLFSNGPNNGMIQLNRETLEIEVDFTGNHSGSMTCVDISSSSGMVLTADVNGLVQLWENDGNQIKQEIQLQSTILDCGFGVGDEYFSISTPDDGIRKWTMSGSELKPIDIDGAEQYQFTINENEIIALKTSPSHHIIVYDYLNEVVVDQTTMFHTFDDYVVLFDDDGNIANIVTNTRVDHIVRYGTTIQRIGVGESGIDTDGDGIPDSLDNDDDGDGIEDNWDLNCVDIGISCKLLPDEDLVRSINLAINETSLVLQQTFTLNKAISASIRDLSRMSLDTDVRLSIEEAQLFADSLCSNLNQDAAISTISATVSIENATLNFSEMECTIKEGMVLVPTNDKTSHIRYSISFVYDFETSQSLDGLEIVVENHRFPETGSITELSDQHPIRIAIEGSNIVTKEYVPWHVQELEVSFTIDEMEKSDEKLSTKSVLSSPITIAVLLIGIFVVGFVAQRLYDRMTKSGYEIILDDDDDENFTDDEYDELENEEPYFEEEFSDDEVIEEVEPKTARRTTEKSTKRVRVRSTEANQAKELLQQSSTEVVRKRKARRSGHDTVTTKRRKLSDTQPIDSKPRKRRAVKRDVGEVEMDETLKRFVSESPEE